MNGPPASDLRAGGPAAPDTAPAGFEATARALAALAHPARLAILRHLSARSGCCVKDVVPHTGLAQSTVSQHLKVLVEAGLVTYRANRQASCYAVDRQAVGRVHAAVGALLAECCPPLARATGEAPGGDESDCRETLASA